MDYISVTIWQCEADSDPWTAVFDDEDKASSFIEQAQKIIDEHDLQLIVTRDSGKVNSTEYLGWLEEYAEDDEYDTDTDNYD